MQSIGQYFTLILTVIVCQLSQMVRPTRLGLPAARWPDHTWNPGEPALGCQAKASPLLCCVITPSHGQLALGSEPPRWMASSTLIHLHINVANNSNAFLQRACSASVLQNSLSNNTS